MASSTKLVLEFYSATGETIQYSYKYAKPSAGTENVKALMQAMITNGTIFARPPVAAKSAKEVITTESVYDLDNFATNLSETVINGNPDIPETEENETTVVTPVEARQ